MNLVANHNSLIRQSGLASSSVTIRLSWIFYRVFFLHRFGYPYLGDKAFPKDITEFEIREFFTLSAADLRAIRVDSHKRSRLALASPRSAMWNG
jgi:hypothetical protein